MGLLEKIGAYLQGKKAYIVAIIVGILATIEAWPGVAIPEFVWGVLAACGLAAVRSAIEKLKPPTP